MRKELSDQLTDYRLLKMECEYSIHRHNSCIQTVKSLCSDLSMCLK